MSNDVAVAGYDSGAFFCEIFGRPNGRGLGNTRRIRERLANLDIAQLRDRSCGAERELLNLVRIAVVREPAQAILVSGTYDGQAEDFIDMSAEVSVSTVQVLQDIA